MAKKPESFEDAIKRLDEIVKTLESGSESLERSIELFEEGKDLSDYCEKALKTAEVKISELKEIDNND